MRTSESIQREAAKPTNISVASVQSGITAESSKKVELDDLNLDLDDDSSEFEDDLYSGL